MQHSTSIAERASASLRLAHRAALALLAAAAIAIATAAPRDAAGGEPMPRSITTAAVLLGVAVVALRRIATSPALGARARSLLSLLSLGGAVGLGALALSLAFAHGDAQASLALVAAAAILILRPPSVT